MALIVLCVRFVVFDQWLTTHVSSTWNIAQLKAWLLYKCLHIPLPADLVPTSSSSPITFAPNPLSNDDDDDDDDDDDVFGNTSHDHVPASTGNEKNHFTLLRFSTGQILEDEFSIAWYSLQPLELIEIHPLNTLIRLPRHNLLNYCSPFFSSHIRLLIRKQWTPNSLVIRDSTLYIDDCSRFFPITRLQILNGPEHLSELHHSPSSRIICAHFAKHPPPSPDSSPVFFAHSSDEEADDDDDDDDPWWGIHRHRRDTGEWIVIDVLDETAFTSLLRILHRLASPHLKSSFVPSMSIDDSSSESLDQHTLLSSKLTTLGAVPYPEWRIDITRKAFASGLGLLSPSFLTWLRIQSFCPLDPNDPSQEPNICEWFGWMADLSRPSPNTHILATPMPSGPHDQALRQFYEPNPHILSHHKSASYAIRSPSSPSSPVSEQLPIWARRNSLDSATSIHKRPRRSFSTGTIAYHHHHTDTRVTSLKQQASSSSVLKKRQHRPVRRVKSGSNILSDAHPGPTPKKPRKGLMRGISVRAEQILRGLDAALDFVEDQDPSLGRSR